MSFGRTPCYIYASSWHGKLNIFSFNRLNDSKELEAGMERSQCISDDEIAQLIYHMSARGPKFLNEYIERGKQLSLNDTDNEEVTVLKTRPDGSIEKRKMIRKSLRYVK